MQAAQRQILIIIIVSTICLSVGFLGGYLLKSNAGRKDYVNHYVSKNVMTTSGGSKATATSTITTGSRVMVKSQNVLTRTDRPRDVCESGCIIYGHSIYQQW